VVANGYETARGILFTSLMECEFPSNVAEKLLDEAAPLAEPRESACGSWSRAADGHEDFSLSLSDNPLKFASNFSRALSQRKPSARLTGQ
jgi:hypothetical protein